MPGDQNSVTTPLANTDIWHEILKYFEISFASDSLAEIQMKRKATIKVALLSPGLTGPALDTLWRSMDTLEPIVRVLNAVASPNNKYITYPIDFDCWVLRRVPTKYQRERAMSYLYRIQYFHALEMVYLKEATLWPTLVACLAIKSNSLLPNLRSLYISCDTMTDIASWINIPPLLSSTIQSLSLSSWSAKIAEVIAMLLQVHDVLPVKITYCGAPSKKVLQSLIHHDGLEILKFDFEGHIPDEPGPSISINQVFSKLTRLKELQVDLRFFSIAGVEVPVLSAENLTNLDITGSALDLEHLLVVAKFPSLDVLKVAISQEQSGGLRWGELCSCIATGAPHLQHLSLRMIADSQIEVTLQDLKLLSNLDLRSLHLLDIRHGLTQFDFGQFGSLWPNLQLLSIFERSDGSLFTKASHALTPLARHPGLRTIELSLDFTGAVHLIPNDSPLPLSHSQITDIICVQSKGTPTSVVGTLKLVQNLLRLFPNLRTIRGREGDQALATVQMAIVTVRELLSYYTDNGRITPTVWGTL